MTVRECCLTKLLPHILFEKKYFSTENGAGPPAQWTSTVPVVSAHFRSLFTATTHRALCEIHRQFPWLCDTPTNVVLHITLFLDAACTLLTSLCKMLKKRRPSKQKNVSKWRQEAHNSLPKFWRIPKLDVRNVQFSPVRWLPPRRVVKFPDVSLSAVKFPVISGFSQSVVTLFYVPRFGYHKKYPAKI